MAINLEKLEQQAPELLSLAKKTKVELEKRNLNGLTSRVAFIADFSGSMLNEYRSGRVQEITTRLLSVASQLDDDGAIDLYFFASNAWYAGEVTLENFRNAISHYTSGKHMGTTNYADAFHLVVENSGFSEVYGTTGGFFKKAKPAAPLRKPVNEPVLAIFLTDGAPDSKRLAIEEITKASFAPVFWQFISIGSENIPFLQRLDDLDNRYIDNADYKPLSNLTQLTDNALLNLLLDEYPEWVQEMKRRGHIA